MRKSRQWYDRGSDEKDRERKWKGESVGGIFCEHRRFFLCQEYQHHRSERRGSCSELGELHWPDGGGKSRGGRGFLHVYEERGAPLQLKRSRDTCLCGWERGGGKQSCYYYSATTSAAVPLRCKADRTHIAQKIPKKKRVCLFTSKSV